MLFDEYGYGFNHINVIVDNFDEAVELFKRRGYEIGQYMESSGKPICYMDCMKGNIRHDIELHEYSPVVAMTRKAREIWDGKDPWMDVQTVAAAMKR
jgi:hypothetical protein